MKLQIIIEEDLKEFLKDTNNKIALDFLRLKSIESPVSKFKSCKFHLYDNMDLVAEYNFSDEEIDRLKNEHGDRYFLYRMDKPKIIKSKFSKIPQMLMDFNNKNYTQKDVEEFINSCKSTWDDMKDNSEFKIVDGKELGRLYNCKNYEAGNGPLNKSCMMHAGPEQLRMYTENPDKIKMLALINKRGKLMGRCILWKLDYPYGKIYADRIYTVKDSDVNRFKRFIDKRGWLSYEKKGRYSKKVVQLNDEDVHIYYDTPYLDTFTQVRTNRPFKTKEEYLDSGHSIPSKTIKKSTLLSTTKPQDAVKLIGKRDDGFIDKILHREIEHKFENFVSKYYG